MAQGKTKAALRRRLPSAAYASVKGLYWSAGANAARRVRGTADALLHRSRFNHVHTVLLFIGYPRSGHSLVGSLLNAHRNVVVAHELHALWYMDRGFNRNQLFSLIQRRDRWFGKHGRQWTEFNYTVPEQWQGKSERIEIIGDKKGDGVTDLLNFYPGLLELAAQRIELPIRIIHTVRNPFDNVATMARRTGDTLSACIQRHRTRTALNQELISRCGTEQVLTVRHEDFVAAPREELSRMCTFLGIDAPAEWLDACGGIVYASPNPSRQRVEWTTETRAAVERLIARTPFLDGYRFDS